MAAGSQWVEALSLLLVKMTMMMTTTTNNIIALRIIVATLFADAAWGLAAAGQRFGHHR